MIKHEKRSEKIDRRWAHGSTSPISFYSRKLFVMYFWQVFWLVSVFAPSHLSTVALLSENP